MQVGNVLRGQITKRTSVFKLRFEGITVVRNGGTHGNVSVNWIIIRNSSDPSPVTADLTPASGELHFAQGQMLATLPLNIINDDIPEEAEAYLLRILAHTIKGGAEVSEPSEVSLSLGFFFKEGQKHILI